MRLRVQIASSLVALAACVLAVGFSAASFTDTVQNPQTASAIADWTAPSAEASVIAPVSGGTPGYLKAKATYYVYAKVADSGSPASGISSVKANVESLTSGQSAVTLNAGSYTLGGVVYNYRSSQLTAGSSTGSRPYTLTFTDKIGNAASQGFSVTVLGAFAGSGFETADGGGQDGKPEAGDTVTFTYSNPPDPGSILSGWTGSAAASVSVAITQSSSNDRLEVAGAALGLVELKGNYVSKTVTFTHSLIELRESSIVVTLGDPSSSSSLVDENSKKAPVWKPSTAAQDLAGSPCSSASVTADKERQF